MVKTRKSPSRKSKARKEVTLVHLQKLAKENNVKFNGLKKSALLAKLNKEGVKLHNGKSRKSRSRKPCKSDQVRDRSTGRCRKRKSPSKKRKASASRKKM